jgi:hemerythrin
MQIEMEKVTPETWESDLEIGIAEIDAQHRNLFRLLSVLRQSTSEVYSFPAAFEALGQLSDETEIHFAVEESLMRMMGYPYTNEHIAEHRRLRDQLNEFRHLAMDCDISGELADFIQSWLVDHVNKSDRRYVDHLLASRIDPTAGPDAV